MNDEYLIEELEKKIRSLQTEVDAIKERKEVWTPKGGQWRLSPNLKPCAKPYLSSGRSTGAGGTYATREEALAAVPLRYNQQMLEAYKREFDPTFKPRFDGSQENYYPWYSHYAGKWLPNHTGKLEDPQRTYFSRNAVIELVKKLNNGTVVLEMHNE